MANEFSPGGSPIYRHKEVAPNSGHIEHADDERISNHYASFHDGKAMVWHELVSDRVHIDVHYIAPSERCPFWFLGTSGMSASPMNVPQEMDGREDWLHAELCMFLPPHWNPSQEAFKDERVYWPVRLLKTLSRIPHDFSSWIGWGHSIPNGDPASPYAPDTELSGAIVIPPILHAKELFDVPGSPKMHIFQILPVTSKEMDLKLQVGVDDMLDTLEKTVPDLFGPVNPLRSSGV